nr:MAG TPA: tail assembly protein [Caudoviricetes sp.]
MAYDFYLGKMLCPVAPSELQIKVNGHNKDLTLINGDEINIIKKAGLTDISFDLLLPNVKHPFATYKSGFKNAKYFLDELEKMKSGKKPFQFIVNRRLPNKKMIFDTNIKVSLEEYSISEDAGDGFDFVVSLKLKQYRDYGTKTCKISNSSVYKPGVGGGAGGGKNNSSNSNKIGIGSDVIVNGRLHRDSYGSGPGQMRTNYRGKVNFINMKGSHPYHVTQPDGGWLGWVTASSVRRV